MITDDYMREMVGRTKEYTAVILHGTPKLANAESQAIVWEHARRNFQLRADGVLRIVCPVNDGSDVSGIGIFDATPDETRRIMDGDPGVQAGIFTYEVHTARGFPGDVLS
jgi:hypothetical protein